jgi:hypothetical protein
MIGAYCYYDKAYFLDREAGSNCPVCANPLVEPSRNDLNDLRSAMIHAHTLDTEQMEELPVRVAYDPTTGLTERILTE